MKAEDVAKTILNLDIVSRARRMIQMVGNAGHSASLNVPKEAFAKRLLKVLFVIVIVNEIVWF